MAVPSMSTTRLMDMPDMLLMLPMMVLLSTQMPQHLTTLPQSRLCWIRWTQPKYRPNTDKKKTDDFNNLDHQD